MPHNILASLFSKPNNKKPKAVMCDRCFKNNCGCHSDFMRQTSNLKIPFMKSIRRDFQEGFDATVDSVEGEKIFSRPRKIRRQGSRIRRIPRRTSRGGVKVTRRPTRTLTRGTPQAIARSQAKARAARRLAARRRPTRVARPSKKRVFRKTTKASRRAARLRGARRPKPTRAITRPIRKLGRPSPSRVKGQAKTVSMTQPTKGRFPADRRAILEAAILRGRARKEARDTGVISIAPSQLETRERLGRVTGRETIGTVQENISSQRAFTQALSPEQGGFFVSGGKGGMGDARGDRGGGINVIVTNLPTGSAGGASGGDSAGNGQGRISFEQAYPKQTGQLIKIGQDLTQLGVETTRRATEIKNLSKFVNERAEFTNKKLVDIDEKLTNLGGATVEASEAIGFNKLLGGLGSTGLIIAAGIVIFLVARR